jgi:hypothetical protein
MNGKAPSSDIQLAEVFAQSQQNSQQIVVLAKAVDSLREALTVGFNDVRDKISDRDKPNFQLATVILAIVGLVGGPIGFAFYRDIDRASSDSHRENVRLETDMRRTTDMLDIKLQNEFRLSMETAKEGLKGLDSTSAGRHDEATKQIEREAARLSRLEAWQDKQVEYDLNELRLRRLKDNGQPK